MALQLSSIIKRLFSCRVGGRVSSLQVCGHRWVHHLQMEEAETEVPFFVDRRSNDQVTSWSANIETEDRSLRSDQAHACVPWSTRAARQSFTWQSGAAGGRSSAEKKRKKRSKVSERSPAQLGALSRKLLLGWTRNRDLISKLPRARSAHDTELPLC